MTNFEKWNILNLFEKSYDELYELESLITVTREVCLKKEFASMYYNLEDNDKKFLSEERNHYINMLTLANAKISNIKHIYNDFENKFVEL